MFDVLFHPSATAPQRAGTPGYEPFPARPRPSWLEQALDQLELALLLVDGDGQVLHANRAARAELARPEHPLQQLGGALRARRSADVAALRAAVHDACCRGLRRLLTLDRDAAALHVAVLPLPADGADPGRCLLLSGPRGDRVPMAVHCFARAHGLTSAEDQVLQGLCRGMTPQQIARDHGVALSTVRTQLASVRAKTRCDSLRALTRCIATLPPMAAAIEPAG